MLSRRRILGACACLLCAGGPAGLARARDAVRPQGSPTAADARPDGPGLPPVHHVGMVVRDRERTLASLSSSLGYGPAYRFEGAFPTAKLANGETGFALRGAFVWMRNTALEVVEPTDDRSPHAEFLKTRGEGLHHLAYWVGSVRGEIEAMARGGAAPRLLADATGPGNAVPWCYLEGDLAGGAIIELIERNPGSEQFYAAVFRAIGGKIPV